MNIEKSLSLKDRVPSPFTDELHFYKARIYDNCKTGDDRLQVRIIPYMNKIPDNELDNLPKYPPLVNGKVIRGYTEKADGKLKASIVYVLATSDFTYGFIVDLVNNMPGCGDTGDTEHWSFEKTKRALQVSNSIPSGFDYENIYVDVRNCTGTYLEMHDVKNGCKYFMTQYGDVISLTPGRILLESRAGAAIGNQYSSVEITPDKVTIDTNTFEVNAKTVMLGHGGMKLLGTLDDIPTSCNGMNLAPIPNAFA